MKVEIKTEENRRGDKGTCNYSVQLHMYNGMKKRYITGHYNTYHENYNYKTCEYSSSYVCNPIYMLL